MNEGYNLQLGKLMEFIQENLDGNPLEKCCSLYRRKKRLSQFRSVGGVVVGRNRARVVGTGK